MKTFRLCLAVAGAVLLGAEAHSANIQFANPVLPGDFPDPSIVRVGEDYWATATSSEWAPLYPILHSRDLVNWELKGHVFDTKPAWSSANYWAPEIHHFNNRFYVYYTARENKFGGRLHLAVATAENPLGPWTDHGPLIGQEDGSIDAYAVQDENNEMYLLWKNDGNSRNEPTFIWAQKLSEDGTRLVGDMHKLIRNDSPWEGNLVEGPAVIRRNGYFYLFYAGNGCCGLHCTYAAGVARSKKLLGPYEKNPNNPILINNEQWRCPGHGSIVTTADGRDFFLYHAYHSKDTVYVGRQGILDEIKWGEDGWPVIGKNKTASVEAPSPHGKAQRLEPEFQDDFSADKLGLQWQWSHWTQPEVRLENGHLALRMAEVKTNMHFGAVVGVRTTVGDYAATTVVENRLKPGAQAGLFAFGDRQNALGVLLGDGKITVLRLQKNIPEVLASAEAPALQKIHLRLSAEAGHKFRFSFWNGRDWQALGNSSEGNYLPPWDRGVRVALTVGGADNAEARFDWIRIVPRTSQYAQQ